MKINDVFDVKRFWMVLRIDLMSNVRIRVLTGVLLGIMIPVFSLIASDRSIQNQGPSQYAYFVLGLSVFIFIGLVFSSRSFNKKINTRYSALTFYLLPASQFEKYLSTFIITSVGYTIVAYGIIAYSFHLAVWCNTFFVHRTLPLITLTLRYQIIPIVFYYLMFQAIFLFGGLSFKKAAAIKTIMLISVYIFSIVYVYKLCGIPSNSGLPHTVSELLELLLVTIFFWFLTYIRLTETEGR